MEGKGPDQDWAQPLVWVVVVIFVAGAVVGLVVADATYGRTFTAFGAGPVKTEADDPATEMDAAVLDVTVIGGAVRALSDAVADLAVRVAALEQRAPGGGAPQDV